MCACMYACMYAHCCACLRPDEVRGGHQISLNWSYIEMVGSHQHCGASIASTLDFQPFSSRTALITVTSVSRL